MKVPPPHDDQNVAPPAFDRFPSSHERHRQREFQ